MSDPSKPDPPTTEQEQVKLELREAFARRLERLNRFWKLNVPDYITATEVMLVYRAALALFPKMGVVVGDQQRADACAGLGVCQHCKVRRINLEYDMCQVCWTAADVDDKDFGEEKPDA